jgi:(p)ppGpp synthase/HD superfamily hydrolase
MLGERYRDAMTFAARLHEGQSRKGTTVVYLSHLLAVSALVLENGGDEDEAIAALLHDALEDQGDDYVSDGAAEPRHGRPALCRDIELRYGPRVLEIVRACTDDEDFAKPANGERGTTEQWRRRKAAYIDHVRGESDTGTLRVSCADKLHNARTILGDYEEQGDAIWERFRARTRENQEWYYGALASLFAEKAEQHADAGLKRLSRDLSRAVDRIRSRSFC